MMWWHWSWNGWLLMSVTMIAFWATVVYLVAGVLGRPRGEPPVGCIAGLEVDRGALVAEAARLTGAELGYSNLDSRTVEGIKNAFGGAAVGSAAPT